MKYLSDRPFMARKQLLAIVGNQTLEMFDGQGGEISNIPAPKQLSSNGDYYAKKLEFRFLRNDNAPLSNVDQAFVSQFLGVTEAKLSLNRADPWSSYLFGLSVPAYDFAATFPATDHEKNVVVPYIINVPGGICFAKNTKFRAQLFVNFGADPSAYDLGWTFYGMEELDDVERAG